jgi:hypothetical protein
VLFGVIGSRYERHSLLITANSRSPKGPRCSRTRP